MCKNRISFTLVRCHCCGIWEVVENWDNKKPSYCEGCSLERTGKGRGQCAFCILYPSSLEHWNDKKPVMPVLYVCVR